MSKFHMTEKGPNRCRAKSDESCPLGTAHYDNFADAQADYETEMEKKYGGISSSFSNLRKDQEVAPGLVAVVDLPMSDFAPTQEIADRMDNPDFMKMKEEYREALNDYLELRERDDVTRLEKLEAYDEYRYRRELVEDYRNETARLVAEVGGEIPDHETKVPDYAEKLGEHPSGSLEWLKMRQNTLGGSDVGNAVAVGKWGEMNNKSFKDSKSKEVEEGDEEINTPAWRGNVWEEQVLKAAEKSLGEKIYTDKSTYSDGKRHANVDGLIPREDGSIGKIIEAKTSSHPEEWEGKVPEGYALQTQHYADFFGSDEAYIAVNIDDERFKIFKVDQDYKVKAGTDTPKELGSEFSYDDVRGYAEEEVDSLVKRRVKAQKNPRKKVRRSIIDTPEVRKTWGNALKKGMVYVDIETTGHSSDRGHIIEVALVKTDGNGNEVERLHKFYGIPEKHEKWNGTGAEHIHNISPDEIRGEPVLASSPKHQKEIQDFVGDKVIIAHYAKFEENWLEANGVKAEYADTRDAFSIAVQDEGVEDNTLRSLVEWSGSKYENAHRAINDTIMMKDSMSKLLPKIKSWLDS